MADPGLEIGSYSEFKGEERPRVFFIHGEKITVLKVLAQWNEDGAQDRRQLKFFRVEGSDRFIHTLYYDAGADGWFYRGFELNRGRDHLNKTTQG